MMQSFKITEWLNNRKSILSPKGEGMKVLNI